MPLDNRIGVLKIVTGPETLWWSPPVVMILPSILGRAEKKENAFQAQIINAFLSQSSFVVVIFSFKNCEGRQRRLHEQKRPAKSSLKMETFAKISCGIIFFISCG